MNPAPHPLAATYAPLVPRCGTPLASVVAREPYVLQHIGQSGAASRWWTFDGLAALGPELPVQLVHGNRERNPTRFVSSTLGEYLRYLQQPLGPGQEPLYLKEFDLLKAFPQLAQDLPYQALFPPGSITAHGAWIGPAGAKTGLHYDYLDNLAWLVAGRKRFYLAPPGSVERVGKLSRKYDRWAQLADIDVQELAELSPSLRGRIYVADLTAGDCLFVPKGWWHQVENLSPSILLGGFFGPRHQVIAQWLASLVRQGAHKAGWLGRGHCTCCGA